MNDPDDDLIFLDDGGDAEQRPCTACGDPAGDGGDLCDTCEWLIELGNGGVTL